MCSTGYVIVPRPKFPEAKENSARRRISIDMYVVNHRYVSVDLGASTFMKINFNHLCFEIHFKGERDI